MTKKISQLGVVTDVPIPANFAKQIHLLTTLFPHLRIDIVNAMGVANANGFHAEHMRSCSRARTWLIHPWLLIYHLRQYIRTQTPDVVMTVASIASVPPVAVIVCKVCRVPIVFSIGGSIVDDYKSHMGYHKIVSYLLRHTMGKLCCKIAGRVITMGPYERGKLIQEGVPANKIIVIPPMVEQLDSQGNPCVGDAKVSLGVPWNSKVVLFVGRVSRLKGAHILTKIAQEVEKRRKDIQFLVVGEGGYRKKLQELENVRTVGLVPPAEMHRYYQAADLLILPSCTEGMPNVILESLSHRVPVVASNVGEIPWIVSNTFEPCDWKSFSDYIVQGGWKLDTLPTDFSPAEQRERFEALFSSVIRSQ